MSTESSIANHPHRTSLATVVRTLALTAADERRSRLGDGLEELVKEHRLGDANGRVGDVDVLAVLRTLDAGKGPSPKESAMLSRLLAYGVADRVVGQNKDDALPSGASGVERLDALAASLTWLAAHTFLDALPDLDAVLGADDADAFWQAVFRRVRTLDDETSRGGRAEALCALAALARSVSPAAGSALRVLADELADPTLKAFAEQAAVGMEDALAAPVLSDDAAESVDDDPDDEDLPTRPRQRRSSMHARRVTFSGDVAPFPLGMFGLVFGAATGLLVVRFMLREGARVLLRTERPVEVRVDGTGLTISSRLVMLGRTLKTEEVAIPFSNLAVLAREVKFPRLGLYAGLITLALGTFSGVSLMGDGARAGSPSLIALGAAVFGVGIALDMVLSSVGVGRGGRHHVLVVPRRGARMAIRVEDPRLADEALRAVSERSS